MDTDPPATVTPREDTSLFCASTTPPTPTDNTAANTASTPHNQPAMGSGYQDPTLSLPHVTRTLPDDESTWCATWGSSDDYVLFQRPGKFGTWAPRTK